RWRARPQLLRPDAGNFSEIYDFATTHDGSTIAYIEKGSVTYWRRDGTQNSISIMEDYWTNLDFAPDGRTMAIVSTDISGLGRDSGVVTFHDSKSGRVLRTVKGLGEQTFGVRYSPDGKRLAVCASMGIP